MATTSVPLTHARRIERVIFRGEHQPLFQVFAANTGLGKTLLSAGLLHSAAAAAADRTAAYRLLYLKPIQTGYPDDSDSRFVSRFVPKVTVKDGFTFKDPVGPHLAAQIVSPLFPFLEHPFFFF